MRSHISSCSVTMSEAGVVFVLCLFLVAATWGKEVESGTGTILGTVVDATPDCSPEKCEKLAKCKSQEGARQVLREILGGQPAPGATVTVASGETKRTTVTDSHGRYAFTGLPAGPYNIHAVMVDSEGKPRRSAPKRTQCDKTVHLVLHGEFITVSGRIVDPNGLPIVGAKVTRTLAPMSEVRIPDTREAVSGANGFCVLAGFEPLNLYRVAGYLNGGSLDAIGALHTQVEIRVQAEGFRQDQANVLRVPLIAEAQLIPGRRLWKALAQFAAAQGDSTSWQEPLERPLPARRGNTVTGIDIVLFLSGSAREDWRLFKPRSRRHFVVYAGQILS